MINFKSVTIRNFLSFGNVPTTLDLSGKETVLVIGENMDIGDEGSSRNGVGKSSSMRAIFYAIYGKDIFSEVKQDELINLTNEKKMEVTLELEVNRVPYTIVRGRKPNFVKFMQGSINLTNDSMKNTDRAIQELLGVTPDGFMMSFFLTSSVTPFMAKKPADQRQFMEDVLGLTVLSERANTLKALKKEAEVELKIAQAELDNVIILNERITKSIEKSYVNAEEFERDRNASIAALEAFIAKYDVDSLLAARDQVFSVKSRLDEKEQAVKTAEEELRLISESMSSARTSIATKSASLLEKERFVEEITATLDRLESEKNRIEAAIPEAETAVKVAKEEFERCAEFGTLSKKAESLSAEYTKGEKAIDSFNSKLEKAKTEIDHLMAENCPYCKQHYNDEESAKKLKSLKDEVVHLEIEIEKTTAEVTRLESEMEAIFTEASAIPEEYQQEPDIGKVSQAEFTKNQLEKDLARIGGEIDRSFDKFNNGGYDEETMDTLRSEIVKLQEDLEVIEKHHQERLTMCESVKSQMAEAKAELSNLEFQSVPEIDRIIEQLDEKENELLAKRNADNPHVIAAESAKSNVIDVNETKEKVAAFEKEDKHYGYLIKLLTNSKSFIRKGIIDQYVGFLNKRINEYAETLGLPHVAQINSDLTVDLEYMRKNVGYYNLSAGERMRLDISTSIAMRELMSLMGVKSNLLLVDEFLDGAVDSSGLKRMFGLLKGYTDHVMLISHREDFNTMVDRVVTVRKQNGFATLH